MAKKPARDLYDVAREVTHSIGMPWTDPRTLKTHPPPKQPRPPKLKLALTFEERKATYANIERIDNAKLHAGMPMFYYCRLCGAPMTRPENHIERAPRYCDDCVGEGRGSNTAT